MENQKEESGDITRYQPDIAVGLTQAQVQERVEQGLRNDAVKPEAKTVWGIIKSNLFTYFNLVFAVLTVLLIAAEA